MKTIKINPNNPAFDNDELYRKLEEFPHNAIFPTGTYKVWEARTRRIINRAATEGVAYAYSMRRAPGTWRVIFEGEVKTDDFVMGIEHRQGWTYDGDQPFPYPSYIRYADEIWNTLDFESFDLKLKGSLGHFLNFVKLDGRDSNQPIARGIIRQCLADGEISREDAFLAQLTL